jgi:Spy/CpxP family protein refolding chaperone
MKKLGILTIALVLTASGVWAFGGGGCGMGMGPGIGMNTRFASDLNLTADQKAQLQTQREALMAETEPLRNELFTKREELRQLWAKPDPDQAVISAKQLEIREIQGQIQERATQQRLGCREILTAEQREKLGTLTAQTGRGDGRGMGRGQGRGMGMGKW